eukprot:4723618-Amphidinium_carterae.1
MRRCCSAASCSHPLARLGRALGPMPFSFGGENGTSSGGPRPLQLLGFGSEAATSTPKGPVE